MKEFFIVKTYHCDFGRKYWAYCDTGSGPIDVITMHNADRFDTYDAAKVLLDDVLTFEAKVCDFGQIEKIFVKQ